MKERSYLFIVNPVAGNHRAKKTFDLLQDCLKKYSVVHSIMYTNKKGAVVELLNNSIGIPYDVVVAVGGDGTVNEVINCLVGTNKILGIIPCGTGNDLAKSLNIPLNPLEALDLLMRGNASFVDLGNAGNYFFTNIASIGLDAEIAAYANKMKNKLPGTKAYLLALIKVLFSFSSYEIYVDNKGTITKKEVMLMAICNGRFYGGGMEIAPDASVVDGMLDVCLIEKMSKWKLLFLFPSVYRGKHRKFKEVQYYKTDKLSIKSPNNILNLDGEIIVIEDKNIEFSIKSKGLKVIIQRESKIEVRNETFEIKAPAS